MLHLQAHIRVTLILQQAKTKALAAMHDAFESSGIFILISSLPFDSEEILEVYYLRQKVEQYFDISKEIS